MKDLLQKIELQFRQKKPFVVYALPGCDKATALMQKGKEDHGCRQFTENGFVFVSFDEKTSLFFPNSECHMHSDTIQPKRLDEPRVVSEVIASEKENYVALVKKAIGYIREGQASKIVTSRRKDIPIRKFDLPGTIDRLFALYPKAFRYVWYHPQSGLWCGATPEVLITTHDSTFSTMALAGTMEHDPDSKPRWTPKELNEQQWVTDALTDKLQHAASVIKVSKVKNHIAGSLVHLRTDFDGVLKKGENSLAVLARSLHPTPAVCGTPDEFAKKFIKDHEGYDRSFYTGFLGPTEMRSGESRLYVNLRCMRISEDKARLYVGGGITEDSNAEDEFLETQNKLQTMLQVLQPML